MQYKVNKSWTWVTVLRYASYDRARKRSRVCRVARISLDPTIRVEIPADLDQLLSAEERSALLKRVNALRDVQALRHREQAIQIADRALRPIVSDPVSCVWLSHQALKALCEALVDGCSLPHGEKADLLTQIEVVRDLLGEK